MPPEAPSPGDEMRIVGFGSYLPEHRVGADYFFEDGDPLAANALLRAPSFRHHAAPEERGAEMIERAARPMFERLGLDPRDCVDILLTNVLLPDNPITGSGAEVAHRLGSQPEVIIDLHNAGCASFMYMLKLARALIRDGAGRTALLCTVQNCAGKLCALPQARTKAPSAIPGDGCGVAYVTAGEDGGAVLAIETRNVPSYALDMKIGAPDGRSYWEPGTSELSITVDTKNLSEILKHGNEIIPTLVTAVCEQIGRAPADVDVLVTSQPNRVYLHNWSQALQIDPARHIDTFDRFGNLMSASVAVTMDHAAREGKLHPGDLVVMAGFAHAGDFAAAAAMRWNGD
ncbi:MAG TPA: 3-oxoacyl-[acyl-carrier-protein] synthase III C-terminal domain-containing protein [Solirubrobacteraceae bacterium]|nr:3-oxoacyl-[acyl-carrier-protein] synthase III C-terminal domain-containing protein [Solirubrobacteraceae bacterium]